MCVFDVLSRLSSSPAAIIGQMGAYHTIELELNRKFTLAKKVWDSVVLDRIGTFQHHLYFSKLQSWISEFSCAVDMCMSCVKFDLIYI